MHQSVTTVGTRRRYALSAAILVVYGLPSWLALAFSSVISTRNGSHSLKSLKKLQGENLAGAWVFYSCGTSIIVNSYTRNRK